MNNMRNLALHIISLANKEVGGISNLQLHKVMYFALGNYIKDNGINAFIQELYQEPFEAWPYGPVLRSEYFRNKIYGRYNIENPGEYNPTLSPLDEYIRKFLVENVKELVDKSHQHRTWYLNRESILNHERVFYTLEDLNNDFKAQ